MSTSVPPTASVRADAATSNVEIPQLRFPGIFGIWAAAALPMAALAWLVAPLVADWFAGEGVVPMFKALMVCLTVGLVWQFILVVILVGREQRTLRWSTVREALWLRSPRSPRSGRIGGRVWLMVIPFAIAFAAFNELIPEFGAPEDRAFATLLESDAGKAFFDGAWGWYGLSLALFVFTTVLGEELLFRGYLLPRMNRAFGRGDWVVNGSFSRAITSTSRGRCRRRCSTRSPSPTRRSATGAPGWGSRCTARRACSLRSYCS